MIITRELIKTELARYRTALVPGKLGVTESLANAIELKIQVWQMALGSFELSEENEILRAELKSCRQELIAEGTP